MYMFVCVHAYMHPHTHTHTHRWSTPWVHATHGVCHTWNPCQGFPVGDACDSDADCQVAGCVCVCACVYVRVYVCVCVRVRVRACVQTYVRACAILSDAGLPARTGLRRLQPPPVRTAARRRQGGALRREDAAMRLRGMCSGGGLQDRAAANGGTWEGRAARLYM